MATKPRLTAQAYDVTNRIYEMICATADEIKSNQTNQPTPEQSQTLQALSRAWVWSQERLDTYYERWAAGHRQVIKEPPKGRLRVALTGRQAGGKVIDICCGPSKQIADTPVSKPNGT